MSTPAPNATKESTALNGWSHLTQVLGVWIPARLKETHRVTVAFRKLRTGH